MSYEVFVSQLDRTRIKTLGERCLYHKGHNEFAHNDKLRFLDNYRSQRFHLLGTLTWKFQYSQLRCDYIRKHQPEFLVSGYPQANLAPLLDFPSHMLLLVSYMSAGK